MALKPELLMRQVDERLEWRQIVHSEANPRTEDGWRQDKWQSQSRANCMLSPKRTVYRRIYETCVEGRQGNGNTPAYYTARSCYIASVVKSQRPSTFLPHSWSDAMCFCLAVITPSMSLACFLLVAYFDVAAVRNRKPTRPVKTCSNYLQRISFKERARYRNSGKECRSLHKNWTWSSFTLSITC